VKPTFSKSPGVGHVANRNNAISPREGASSSAAIVERLVKAILETREGVCRQLCGCGGDRAGQSRAVEGDGWPSFRHGAAPQQKQAPAEKGLKMGSKHRPMGDKISHRTT